MVLADGAVSYTHLKSQEWNETKLHYEPVGEPVDMKQAIIPEVKAQCEALGKAMAELSLIHILRKQLLRMLLLLLSLSRTLP